MTGKPEFSCPVDAATLPAKGMTRRIVPDAAQRAAIARRLGLVSLDAFDIEIAVTPWRGDGVRLAGSFTADVVQTCVVTLEPVAQQVADTFEVRFLPPEKIAPPAPGEEIELTAEDEDTPEPLGGPVGTALDAGELAVQYLSLALDPYPRAPGAALPDAASDDGGDVSPFAALAALKNSGEKK